MIYTEQQLKELILPIIETVKTDERPGAAEQAANALINVLARDREAFKAEAPSDTSDGFHTFKDLYRFRMLYNAALFNEWAISDAWTLEHDLLHEERHFFNVHKSYRHSDGELCFGKENYFVVQAELPTGQISNHYKGEHWDLFAVPEVAQAAVWDGHTAQMVADRLEEFLRGYYDKK